MRILMGKHNLLSLSSFLIAFECIFLPKIKPETSSNEGKIIERVQLYLLMPAYGVQNFSGRPTLPTGLRDRTHKVDTDTAWKN